MSTSCLIPVPEFTSIPILADLTQSGSSLLLTGTPDRHSTKRLSWLYSPLWDRSRIWLKNIMVYKALLARCECGQDANSIKAVWLTSDHQLMLQWRCRSCKRMVVGFKPLTHCWRECPRQATALRQRGRTVN
jgi:hypothetical protein